VSDTTAFAAMIGGFAALATAHAAIVYGLARRAPRWRAAVALVLVPLAPYWAAREKMPVRCAAWIAGAVAYLAARWRG
jgi:hypothetical protein